VYNKYYRKHTTAISINPLLLWPKEILYYTPLKRQWRRISWGHGNGHKVKRSIWKLCIQGFTKGNDDVNWLASTTQQRDPTYMWFKPILVGAQQHYELLFLEHITWWNNFRRTPGIWHLENSNNDCPIHWSLRKIKCRNPTLGEVGGWNSHSQS